MACATPPPPPSRLLRAAFLCSRQTETSALSRPRLAYNRHFFQLQRMAITGRVALGRPAATLRTTQRRANTVSRQAVKVCPRRSPRPLPARGPISPGPDTTLPAGTDGPQGPGCADPVVATVSGNEQRGCLRLEAAVEADRTCIVATRP